jgi:A/G-specific adenine glycosylase
MPNAARRQQPPPDIDAAAVLDWYDVHARDLPWRVGPGDRGRGVRPDPYRVWLSEIMLQQTTVATVGNYFRRFVALWPTVADLAAAPLDAVLKQWAGLGYYARARHLHACATAVVAEHGGRFPASSAELLALPGVGPYTAAAIAAIAYDEPVPVIDGNVDRVMARYLAIDGPVREAKPEISAALSASMPARAGDFAQALMDIGATICAPRAALCMLCPLQPGCAGTRGDPLDYPFKAVKATRPTRFGHAFVMRDADGDVFLRSRPATGLLAKMTETPTSDWTGERIAPRYPAAAAWRHAGQVVHVFTHFRLELEVWTATVDPVGHNDGWWTAPDALGGEALPTLFRKVIAVALDEEAAGSMHESRRHI